MVGRPLAPANSQTDAGLSRHTLSSSLPSRLALKLVDMLGCRDALLSMLCRRKGGRMQRRHECSVEDGGTVGCAREEQLRATAGNQIKKMW